MSKDLDFLVQPIKVVPVGSIYILSAQFDHGLFLMLCICSLIMKTGQRNNLTICTNVLVKPVSAEAFIFVKRCLLATDHMGAVQRQI